MSSDSLRGFVTTLGRISRPLFLRRPNFIYPRRPNWCWRLGLWQQQRKSLVGPWAWTMRLLRRVTKVRSKMPLWMYWSCKMCEWWMGTWMTSLTTCSGQDIGAEHGLTFNEKKSGLYPFQALVLPVSLRFKYHFEGTRQTNRIDKVITCFMRIFLLFWHPSSLSGILLMFSTSPTSTVNLWKWLFNLCCPRRNTDRYMHG